MSNQVQIDIMLFLDMCNLIKRKDELNEEEYNELYKSVCIRIDDKLQRITNRILYSRYKGAKTEEEKEKTLKEYLKERGFEQNIYNNKDNKNDKKTIKDLISQYQDYNIDLSYNFYNERTKITEHDEEYSFKGTVNKFFMWASDYDWILDIILSNHDNINIDKRNKNIIIKIYSYYYE